MTGVEAVSNGVMAFREPRADNARRALSIIIATLIVLLFGIAWLAKHYGIMAMDPRLPNYHSLLSLIVPYSSPCVSAPIPRSPTSHVLPAPSP